MSGGWIPVSQAVVDQPTFAQFLEEEPLFQNFIDLAGSQNQYPVPVIPGAPFFNNEVKNVSEAAMASPTKPDLARMLEDAQKRIQLHIDRAGKR